MNKQALVAFVIVTFAAPLTLWAQQTPERDAKVVELALSDDTLQASYLAPTRISSELRGQKQFSVFLSESRDLVGAGAILIDSDLRLLPRLTIQLGPKAYAALLDEENEDVVAISFGVQARFDISRRRALALVGYAFYAPDILSFAAADNLTDLMARAEMRLTSRLSAFAGLRWFEFDQLMGEERTLQDEMFAGVQWQLE